MDGHFEHRIRRRAYELWVQGGMVDGYDRDHWHRAESEFMMQRERASPKKPARTASVAARKSRTAAGPAKKAPVRRRAAAV